MLREYPQARCSKTYVAPLGGRLSPAVDNGCGLANPLSFKSHFAQEKIAPQRRSSLKHQTRRENIDRTDVYPWFGSRVNDRLITPVFCLALSACGAAASAPEDGFVCTPTAVWDGDGPIWCDEGPRIRLAGIAARETDGSCRPGHPCPSASAEEARSALVDLLGGDKGRLSTGHIRVEHAPLQCDAVGESYHRVVATCELPDGRDLSAEMVRSGTVLPW